MSMLTLDPLSPLMSAWTFECKMSFAVGAKLKLNNRSVRVVGMLFEKRLKQSLFT